MILIRWFINAGALILVSYLLTNVVVDSWWAALMAAAILGLVNIFIRPFLLIITLPINLLTVGLFTFVVNALMLLLVSSIVQGFQVIGFSTAVFAAIILWLISLAVDQVLAPKNAA
jgi:putative membrane protein